MWSLWFYPLVTWMFYAGVAVAVLWYLLRVLSGKRPKFLVAVTAAVAIPIGCAALPIVAFSLLAAVAPLFQKSDTELYEELFGHPPDLGEDRLLFDDFGDGAQREIFMRAETTIAEREKMLATVPLRASKFTLNDFAALADRHGGFSWWISTDPHMADDRCETVRIREAHGVRGWREFRVAECLGGRTGFPADLRDVYVSAWGRP